LLFILVEYGVRCMSIYWIEVVEVEKDELLSTFISNHSIINLININYIDHIHIL